MTEPPLTTDDLSNIKRAGGWADAKARRMRRDYARKNWRLLAGVSVVLILAGGMAAALEPRPFASGLLFGTVVGALLVGVGGFVAVLSGSTSVTLGSWAEGWTADALQGMRQHGYELINSALVGPRGDIDHVLVGPGGLFVFESKWSSHPWSLENDPFVRRAMSQVADGSNRIRLWLHPPCDPTKVVVLWGAAANALDAVPAGSKVFGDGTVVVRGTQLEAWLTRRSRAVLSPDQVQVLHSKIAQQTLAQARGPHRPANSIWTLTLRTVGAALASLLVPSLVASVSGAWSAGAVALLMLVGSLALRSRTGWRLASTASITICTFWLAISVVAFASQQV